MVSGYPVHFDVDVPARSLNRLTTAFRIIVAIPILIVLGTLSGETLHANNQTTTYTLASGGGGLFLPLRLMILFPQKDSRRGVDWDLHILRFLRPVYPALGLLAC